MQIDTGFLASELSEIPALARAAEAMGFDGIWTAEAAHDPFLPLTLAAEHTESLSIGTGIAVAFPRSPGTLAYLAWDLANFSKGRFILGLGPQVKAHNERRFGVKWERPVAKMREVILALRAFWDCWQNGSRLNFRGEFFKLTLMSPFFSPGPIDYPDIPIYLAGVNRHMCHLAGELAQGLHVHPLHTKRYIEDFVLPHVETGLRKAGRQRQDIALASAVFVVPTEDAAKARHYEFDARQQISFYASTPAYRVVMDLHGWGDTAEQLGLLAARRKWSEMPALISDEMMETFVVYGTWADLPAKIKAKYAGGLLDRVSYYHKFVPGDNETGWQATISGFK